MIKCVICERQKDEEFGHNPRPLFSEGRCCDFCNKNIVIPTRISELVKSDFTNKTKRRK
jgi:hypothetical protein